MRILVAEDDPVSRAMLVRALELLGYSCTAAADGLDAWDRFVADGADVVVSDWLMPRVDGIELCRRIRARDHRRYTYIIVLTALGEHDSRLVGMRAGADDYLAKPLDREELQLRLIAAERVTKLHRMLEDQARELARLNHEFFEVGRRDPLTGIANRRRMQEDLIALESALAGAGPETPSVCIALFDIDHFKRYNDHYLHLAGDEVLRRVAGLLSLGLAGADAIYRYGGEEFLVILPHKPLAEACAQVETMRAMVASAAIPHAANPDTPFLTVSAGVAPLAIAPDASFLNAVRAADEALLSAKRAGRDRVVAAGLPHAEP